MKTTTEIVANTDKHWGLTGTLLWGTLVAGLFLLVQLVVAIAVAVATRGKSGHSQQEMDQLLASLPANGTAISISIIGSALVCTPLLAGIAKLKRGSVLSRYFAMQPVALKTVGIWCVVLTAIAVISDALAVMLGRPVAENFVLSTYASAHPAWLPWIALVFAAPLIEEFFFRGFLFKGLLALGVPLAVFSTAALWALLHIQYDYYNVALIFIMGLVMGLARARTGSIFTTLAMHAVINFIASLEAVLFQ